MAIEEKNSVIVELYDLTITGRKDDRYGRVVITKSLSEDDLIKVAVSRRTDINAATLKLSMNILKEIAIEHIANGASVCFGPGYFNLLVNGVFIGDNARWNASQNSLMINVTPTAELRNAVKTSMVDVRGMAASGLIVNTLTDISSGEVNSRLTPGGGVNITGNKIKIDGNSADIGISLINQLTNEIITIPKTSLLLNNPSKITFIVPAALPYGDYKLSISTQFTSGNKLLNEPRVYIYDYVLNVFE